MLLVEVEARGIVAIGADGGFAAAPWPTLGDEPVDPTAYRPIEVRTRDGRAEVRADGVIVASGLALPTGPARLGLSARGVMAFDGVAVVDF